MGPAHGSIYKVYIAQSPSLLLNLRIAQNSLLPSTDAFRGAWIVNEAGRKRSGRIFWVLRNVQDGTFLQLRIEGSQLVLGAGRREVEQAPGTFQEWFIDPDAADSDSFVMQCRGNDAYLIQETSSTAGIIATLDKPQIPTLWKFDCISQTGDQIRKMMRENPHLPNQAVEYLSTDSDYLILPDTIRQAIWTNSKLGQENLKWRQQIFDCDDFAFTAKAEVAKWAARNLQADGFSILFGITFGTNDQKKKHAFNWYLTQDLKGIVFFEPQKGVESYDGWNFKGDSGIF